MRQRSRQLTQMTGPLVAGLFALVGGVACNVPDIEYVLVFPSLETFLLSQNARVEIYSSEDDQPDAICRTLSVNQSPGAEPLDSTGKREVCEFQSGLVFEGVGVGRLVFFAEAQDQAGTALMRGCRVADVYADSAPIEVTLATLPTYPDIVALTCDSVEDKCGDTQASCVE